MANTPCKTAQRALEWYVDNGVDEALAHEPVNKLGLKAVKESIKESNASEPEPVIRSKPAPVKPMKPLEQAEPFLGKSDARSEAIRLATAANTLEELREALAAFDGLAIRKTATNLVFSDGNPASPVMLVGEAPGADEDRLGKPFVGVSGQLLDRILKCINFDRAQEDPALSVYISNILNWRPPGNRTPSPAEIEVSLPFIEKHIALVKPKILILCGGVSAKALLGRDGGVSRLRKTWHDYKPLTRELGLDGFSVPAIATYHPSYLLRTPSQKRAVWADMLMIQEKLRDLNRN